MLLDIALHKRQISSPFTKIDNQALGLYLDLVEHFLCLIFPTLISHGLDLLLQRLKLILPSPIRALHKRFLGASRESALAMLLCLEHNLGKIVLLATEPVEHLLLKRNKTGLVQILELA